MYEQRNPSAMYKSGMNMNHKFFSFLPLESWLSSMSFAILAWPPFLSTQACQLAAWSLHDKALASFKSLGGRCQNWHGCVQMDSELVPHPSSYSWLTVQVRRIIARRKWEIIYICAFMYMTFIYNYLQVYSYVKFYKFVFSYKNLHVAMENL